MLGRVVRLTIDDVIHDDECFTHMKDTLVRAQDNGITVEVVQRRDGGFRSTWARVGAPASGSTPLRGGPPAISPLTGFSDALYPRVSSRWSRAQLV